MPANTYERAFDDAVRELGRVLTQKQETEERMVELREAVFSLYRMLDRGDAVRQRRFTELLERLPAEIPNLSDAVRDAVYYRREQPATAVQVRDALVKRAPEFLGTPNLLANVHTTLKRLARQGELSSQISNGEATYSWAGPAYGARKSLANMLSRPSGFTARDWEESVRLSHAVQQFMKKS